MSSLISQEEVNEFIHPGLKQGGFMGLGHGMMKSELGAGIMPYKVKMLSSWAGTYGRVARKAVTFRHLL